MLIRRKLIRSTSGFTIAEMTVAVALTGVLALAIMAVSQNLVQSNQKASISPTRDQILGQIRLTAGDPNSLITTIHSPGITNALTSAANNSQLYQCICGTNPNGTCTSMQTTAQYPYGPPITLYNHAGQVQSPAYYDAFGQPCNTNGAATASSGPSNCYIEVDTYFQAECMPTLPSTNQLPPAICRGGPTPSPSPAELILITYRIQQTPWTTGAYLSPQSGPIYSQVTDLVQTSGMCP